LIGSFFVGLQLQMEEEILKNFFQLSDIMNLSISNDKFYDSLVTIISSLLQISEFNMDSLLKLLFSKYEKDSRNEIEILVFIQQLLVEEEKFKEICFSYLKKGKVERKGIWNYFIEIKGEITPKQKISILNFLNSSLFLIVNVKIGEL
jgi:hypothetical protein